MTRSLNLCVSIVGLIMSGSWHVTAAADPEQTTVSGVWHLTIKTREGKPYERFLKIERRGTEWTVSLISEEGASMPVDQFEVQDGKLWLQSSVTGPCGKWVSAYSATLTGEILKGTLVSRPAYSHTISVTSEWEATRVERAPTFRTPKQCRVSSCRRERCRIASSVAQ